MRFSIPGEKLRKEVRDLLIAFYEEGDEDDLREALRLVTTYYGIPMPRVRWRRSVMDRGYTAARTHADNRLELMRPESWHLQKVLKPTPETYADTVFHEVYHLVTFVDEEKKADAFARRWME